MTIVRALAIGFGLAGVVSSVLGALVGWHRRRASPDLRIRVTGPDQRIVLISADSRPAAIEQVLGAVRRALEAESTEETSASDLAIPAPAGPKSLPSQRSLNNSGSRPDSG
jgi:hypothetical protein